MLQTHKDTQIKFTTYVFIHLLLHLCFLFKTLINFPFNKRSMACKSFLPKGFSISFLCVILDLATESESKNPEVQLNIAQVKIYQYRRVTWENGKAEMLISIIELLTNTSSNTQGKICLHCSHPTDQKCASECENVSLRLSNQISN